MKVTLMIPCFVDAFFPNVGISVVTVLQRLGHTVAFAADVLCCGQPAFNSGYWDEARPAAQRAIDCLKDADAVVIPSGSCAAMMKNFYPHLLEHSATLEAAKSLSERTHEFSSFLVNQLGVVDVGAAFAGKVTYHDGCHGLRELNNKQEPRTLLQNVRGLSLVEMSEAETCCGFGGTFATKFPMISTAMGETKCASALETGADYIVSSDSSCLMQIQGLIDRQKKPIRTLHLAEILAQR